jgi:hypothetical protein
MRFAALSLEKVSSRSVLVLTIFAFVGAVSCSSSPGPTGRQTLNLASGIDRESRARLAERYRRMPLYFIENHGQLDSRVAYYVQGQEAAVYFTAEGITVALAGKNSIGRWAVKLDFVGASPDVRIAAIDQTPALVSYFKGPREQWKTGLSTYGAIVYADLWPGIDLVYSGSSSRLKYTFLVKPGADPDQIRLAYRGASGVRLGEGGALDVETPVGGFRDERPYSYQEVAGRRVEIPTAYRLATNGTEQTATYGFEISSYDKTRPLVLDPVMLLYAGYIGGLGDDFGHDIAVDAAGNAYVTSYTSSSESSFPVLIGPDLTHNGSVDAFVAKINAAGTGLLYAGYIGGSGNDHGQGIAVDTVGNAYVSGYTNSTESTFPVTVGPDLTHNGAFDSFVAKVNAVGNGLLYAGYIGGAADDFSSSGSIAVDTAGSAYVVGFTQSTQTSFPVLVGPDVTHNGDRDVFIAKVNVAGSGLLYAGYIGGSGTEEGGTIVVDGAGNAFVAASTNSTQASFPVTVGPDLTHNGSFDAFVAKVNAAGTGLLYAGYIGGSSADHGLDVAVDSAGNAYVSGDAGSTQATFPVMVGPDLTHNGNLDAFVAKVNAAGTGLLYAGYIGGAGQDQGFGIAVDAAGDAHVSGFTNSAETTFPVTVGPDLTWNGGFDAFVAEVHAAGATLIYCGYIGGSGDDFGIGIAVDAARNAYVTGFTNSTEASFPVTVGPDLTHNGNFDAFVAKVPPDAIPLESVVLIIDEESIDNGNPPNFFSPRDVNDDVAEIGIRAQLRYFAEHLGTTITLYTGQMGDEGWFALTEVPASWAPAGGLAGYVGNSAANPEDPPPHGTGPGLGAPDANGDRESLLDNVPDVTPLRAEGLKKLEGRQVCAVVYDANIGINYGPLTGNLKGANLGTVGFEVVSVTPLVGASSSSLPEVRITILDARVICTRDRLIVFTDAPKPTSLWEPFDVVP